MKISTSHSTRPKTIDAVNECCQMLLEDLGSNPTLLIVYASMTHDPAVILEILHRLLPGVPVHGGTSCLGVMTQAGFISEDGTGMGMFGILDRAGDYGVGVADLGQSPRQAAAEAITQALEGANRQGEPPDLIWVSGAPGAEEEMLLGIQDVVGPDVPVTGGSTADNTVSGNWKQFANGQVFENAVVITALYPEKSVAYAFHSGYSPSEITGTVTKCQGRVLLEIDGRPAAELYNEWTGGVITDYLGGGNVLAHTTLHPLGRIVGDFGDMPYYRLSHPDAVTTDGGLSLFSNIKLGDVITLMTGTRESLVSRVERVATAALVSGRTTTDRICGALVIYCAGCMLTIQNDMDSVVEEISGALDGKPFLGAFTFGEQGCFIGGENHHGNLMISVVVFEE